MVIIYFFYRFIMIWVCPWNLYAALSGKEESVTPSPPVSRSPSFEPERAALYARPAPFSGSSREASPPRTVQFSKVCWCLMNCLSCDWQWRWRWQWYAFSSNSQRYQVKILHIPPQEIGSIFRGFSSIHSFILQCFSLQDSHFQYYFLLPPTV